MITRIKWDLSKKLPFRHMKNIDFFINNSEVEFKEGLNIITGDNGSGKSTLVNIIKYYFLERYSNIPTLNKDEWEHLSLDVNGKGFPTGVCVEASYRTPTVSMLNPAADRKRIDRITIENKLCKGSSGENVMREYVRCTDTLYDRNLDYRSPLGIIESSVPSDWYLLEDIKKYYLDNDTPDRIPAVIMDEPDNSVSVPNIMELKSNFDSFISNCSQGLQGIFVLHNPVLLISLIDKPEVNFIETTPGYIQLIKQLRTDVFK